MPKMTSPVPPRRTSPLPVKSVCGKNTSSGISAPRLAMRPMMMGYPRARPSRSIPRPNRTAPIPQPSPKRARIARSFTGDAEYTAKISGTSRSVMTQLKTNMPSREKVAQVCSHDHCRTIVMGSTNVPCSRAASSTRRKPMIRGIRESRYSPAQTSRKMRKRRLLELLQCRTGVALLATQTHLPSL